jgi:hypothetical protein
VLKQSFPNLPDAELQAMVEQELGKRSLRDMTIEELEQLDEQVSELRAEGKRIFIEKKAAEEAAFVQVLGQMVGEIGGSAFWFNKGTEAFREKTKSTIRQKIYFSIYNKERIADDLGKTWKEVLVDRVNELENEKIRIKDERLKRFTELKERTGISEKDLVSEVGPDLQLQEAMGIWILSQNEDGKAAVEAGNNFGPKQLRYARTLIEQTPEYRQFAQGIMALFDDESFARLQQAVIANTNQAMKRVENYFPLFRQDAGSEQFANQISQELSSRSGATRNYVGKGFTKERTHARGINQPHVKVQAVTVALEAIEKQEHYAAYAAHVKLMNKLLHNKSLKEAFVDRYGREGWQSMNEYVQGIADPNIYRAMDMGSKFFEGLRNNYTKAVLSWNAMSPIKNLVGPLLYLANPNMTAAEMAENGVRLIKNMLSPWKLRQMAELVNEIDPQARRRTFDPALETMGLLRKKGLLEKFVDAGLKPLEWIDKWTVIVGAAATYETMLKHGEDVAIKAAQDATRRTQPQGSHKDRAGIYNGPAKIWLMFTSPMSQMLGMVKDAKQAKSKLAYGTTLVTAFSLTGLLMYLFDNKEPPEDPEELVVALASQWLQIVPLLGPDLGATFESAVLDKYNPYIGRGFTLGSALPDLARGIESVTNPDRTALERADAAVNAVTSGMNFLGMPGVATRRMWDLATEGKLPPSWELIMKSLGQEVDQ